MRLFRAFLLTVNVIVLFASAAVAQQRATEWAFRDPNLPVEERVRDLVSRMTLEEKVSQIGHTSDGVLRLGIPEYNWWNEGLHGVARAGNATVFPQAIGMAAMFDEPLMHRIADVISTEFRAKYYAELHPDGAAIWYRGLTVWSPNINIFRDPRWGRGQETYGEDPFLTARLGVAFVTGLQGNDPKYFKTIATAKHFAVHSGPESTRHSVDVTASAHDIADTYLPAFRSLVVEGRADSVMCAYNSLNGQPACANTFLLQDRLRRDWNFQGYVVSDCGAITDVSEGHHFSKTLAEGVAASLKAGTDLICGSPRSRVQAERDALLAAVKQGVLPEADLDRAMLRLFTARFRLGMFDPQSLVPFSKIPASENDSADHRALALQAARESIVLLKNRNHFLPLKNTPRKIAVIGPNADSLDALIGNYAGDPSHPVTVLAGLRNRFPNASVVYVQGTGLVGPVTRSIPSDALYTDGSMKEHGARGEYFSNVKLEGPPAFTRVDQAIDFAWGDTGATPDLLKEYSVRWTGVVVPPESGDYHVGFTGQDGYRMWFDGNMIAEDWTIHHPSTTQSKPFHLEKGHAYPVTIEYFETIRSAEARLVWSLPHQEIQDAMAAVKEADLVVAAMGLSPRIEGEEMKVAADGFASGDRTKLDLPVPQQQLLEKIQETGKPIVLLLLNGSALSVNWAGAKLPAIVEAFYPGGEGGTAIAEAIAGDFSPAGRLPVTFYKSVDQLPAFDDYSMAKRTYRYFDGEALYPFGYGLSYTSFAYGKPKLSSESIPADGSETITVEVSNTGLMAGDEVVQLYLSHPGITGAPLRALQGFQRIHLYRSETKTVSFTLRDRDLSIVDQAGKRLIAPGKVEVWLGGGQEVVRDGLPKTAGTRAEFRISSESILPE